MHKRPTHTGRRRGEREKERGKRGEGKKQDLVRVENDNKLTSVASQLKASDRVKSKWPDWITDRIQWRRAGVAFALGFTATSMWAIGVFGKGKKKWKKQINNEILADLFLIPQRREMKSHQNLETSLRERADCTQYNSQCRASTLCALFFHMGYWYFK